MKTNSTIKKIVLAAVTSGVLLAPAVNAAPIFEDENPMTRSHKGAKMMKKMARYLALSEQQITQIKEIKQQSRAEGEVLRDTMKAFKEQVKALKNSAEFDEQAFTAIYAQYQDTFAQMALQKAKSRHAVYQVLTEEQRAKWQAFKEKRKAKRRGKRAEQEG